MQNNLIDLICQVSPVKELKVGSVVTAKVNSVSDFGIDASTSSNIRCLIPKSSLAPGQAKPLPGQKWVLFGIGSTLPGIRKRFLPKQFLLVLFKNEFS